MGTRLTDHQAETLRLLVKWHNRTHRPVPVAEFGSRGALKHLASKGYVTIHESRGPRGGEMLHAMPVYSMIPSRIAMAAIGMAPKAR